MPYTTREAIVTLSTYLGINLGVSVKSIDQTSNRGYEIRLPSGERCVIFVYPISHKQDDSKNFFDTRDSGARERGVAWNYAQTHNLKYFCLAVHDQVDKYKDYIFSLECDEHRITEVSGTLNGSRNGRGTQVVIPTSCIPSKNFERIYTDNGFYIAVVHKGHIYDYLEQYDNRPYMDKTLPLVDINDVEDDNSIVPSIPSPFTPCQIIYYGVPGCGKSHTVDAEINKAIKEYNVGKEKDLQITYEKQVIRTVFHPDYCNADFVGQLMPKKGKESGIKYEFKPGPLATIIRKAYLNPKKPYFLVIEEINRGNAAAIFGEMFQLLDRYKKNEHSKTEDTQNENYDYTEGWSKYSVNNDELNEFILLGGESKIVEKEPGVEYDSDFPDGPKAAIKIPSIGLHFSTYCGVRLPPNLSIYATMNTSDQNVFTLDNAFQRRWEMKQVPNKLRNSLPENATEEQKKDLEAEIAQYDESIGETNVKWGVFRDEINRIIMKSAEDNGLSSMEDKRLGGWFIVPKKPDEKEDSKAVITKPAFAEKVLKYLWDDAFKFDRNSHFNFSKDEEPTLEKLIENFETKDFEVFIDPKIRELQKKTPSGDSPQNAATKEQ